MPVASAFIALIAAARQLPLLVVRRFFIGLTESAAGFRLAERLLHHVLSRPRRPGGGVRQRATFPELGHRRVHSGRVHAADPRPFPPLRDHAVWRPDEARRAKRLRPPGRHAARRYRPLVRPRPLRNPIQHLLPRPRAAKLPRLEPGHAVPAGTFFPSRLSRRFPAPHRGVQRWSAVLCLSSPLVSPAARSASPWPTRPRWAYAGRSPGFGRTSLPCCWPSRRRSRIPQRPLILTAPRTGSPPRPARKPPGAPRECPPAREPLLALSPSEPECRKDSG